jgi:hypothetical protein
MTERELPKYRVLTQTNGNFEIQGFLEYREFGAVAFINRKNQIIKLLAHGTWIEVTRITD